MLSLCLINIGHPTFDTYFNVQIKHSSVKKNLNKNLNTFPALCIKTPSPVAQLFRHYCSTRQSQIYAPL